jgi:DNA-binding response OmpR family regulator
MPQGEAGGTTVAYDLDGLIVERELMRDSSKDDRVGLLLAGLGSDLLARLTGRELLSSIRLIVAAGQRDAVRAAHRSRPRVAVVNRQLFDGDGLRLTSLLKEITPDLTVIATGEGREAREEVEAYSSGASLYLPQPLDAELLARVIVSCLERAGQYLKTTVA